MANVADAATEVIADVAEEVAEQAQYVAEKSRGMSGREVGLVLGGMVIGATLGGVATFVVTRHRLETKYSRIAEEQIDIMREHFRKRQIVRDEKPSLDELAKEHQEVVAEEGYSGDEGPPMAVQPPENVVEAIEDAKAEPEIVRDRALEEHRRQAMERDPQLRNIFEEQPPPNDDWDWVAERAKRSPLRPYVIHLDERQEADAYTEVSFTYYDLDDVLCNERDEVIGRDDGERAALVGEDNLNKFGHGSSDSNVVYVRNDRLELDMEICRSPNSYAQEVHGFDPPEIQHEDRHRGRRRFDDE